MPARLLWRWLCCPPVLIWLNPSYIQMGLSALLCSFPVGQIDGWCAFLTTGPVTCQKFLTLIPGQSQKGNPFKDFKFMGWILRGDGDWGFESNNGTVCAGFSSGRPYLLFLWWQPSPHSCQYAPWAGNRAAHFPHSPEEHRWSAQPSDLSLE